MTDDAPRWLIELPTCPSTNDWAIAHVDALAHGACVWTRKQTHGRGRGSARWHAPPGVLTASFVLDLSDALDATRLSLAAGLATCHAIEDACPGLRVQLKWPNDCVIGDRKVAGILCERPAVGGRAAVVVGIGVNVDPQWDLEAATLPLAVGACPPIGLAEAHGAAPTMADLLAGLRRYLLEACGVLAADAWPTLARSLAERDALRDREIELEANGRRVRGIARGFASDGALLVASAGGTRALASAHVIAIGAVTSSRSAT